MARVERARMVSALRDQGVLLRMRSDRFCLKLQAIGLRVKMLWGAIRIVPLK